VLRDSARLANRLNDTASKLDSVLADAGGVLKGIDGAKVSAAVDNVSHSPRRWVPARRGSTRRWRCQRADRQAEQGSRQDRGGPDQRAEFLGSGETKTALGDIGQIAGSSAGLPTTRQTHAGGHQAGINRVTGPAVRQYEALAEDRRKTLNDIGRTLRSLEKIRGAAFGSKPTIPSMLDARDHPTQAAPSHDPASFQSDPGRVSGRAAHVPRPGGLRVAPPTTFDLAVPSGAVRRSAGAQLVVAEPVALQTLDSDRIIVTSADGSVSALPGAQWSDRLPRLVQTRLVQTFENAGRAVGRAGGPLAAQRTLYSDLRRFGIVTAGSPQAVVEITARMVDTQSGRIVASRIFRVAVPVGSVAGREAGRGPRPGARRCLATSSAGRPVAAEDQPSTRRMNAVPATGVT